MLDRRRGGASSCVGAKRQNCLNSLILLLALLCVYICRGRSIRWWWSVVLVVTQRWNKNRGRKKGIPGVQCLLREQVLS